MKVSSLPKWAQGMIKSLESSVEYYRLQAERADAGDTEVVIRDHNGDIGLPPGSTISFIFRDPNNPEVELGRIDAGIREGGVLNVMGVGRLVHDQLRVLPRSSNLVHIELVPWEDDR